MGELLVSANYTGSAEASLHADTAPIHRRKFDLEKALCSIAQNQNRMRAGISDKGLSPLHRKGHAPLLYMYLSVGSWGLGAFVFFKGTRA